MTGSNDYQAITIDRGVKIVVKGDDVGLLRDGEIRKLLYYQVLGYTFPEEFDVERTGPSGEKGVAFVPVSYAAERPSRWYPFSYETMYWVADEKDVQIFREKLWPGEIRQVKSHFFRIHAHKNFDVRKALKGARQRRLRGALMV